MQLTLDRLTKQNNHDEVDLRYIEAHFGGSNL